MRFKKSVISVITALILVLSIPFTSVSGLSITDSDMLTYTPHDKVTGNLLGEFDAVGVWYHFSGSDFESCGIFDSGNPMYAFIIWIPTRGYFLVSVQSMDMRYQLKGKVNSGGYNYDLYGTLFITKNTDGGYVNSYYNWNGTGTFNSGYDTYNHFQTTFLGNYIVFHKIFNKTTSMGTPIRSSSESYTVPNYDDPPDNLKDQIQTILNQYFGSGSTVSYIDGSSSPVVTYPNGHPVPTDVNGQPVPTNPDGSPAETLTNGMPVPTYPNGDPVQYYRDNNGNLVTVPYDPINGQPYSTIVWNGEPYPIPPDKTVITDPDTHQPLPNPDNPSEPWVEQVTIYNDENGKQDISNEFSKLNEMISDMDNLESYMSSNQADLSGHVDNTRNLINGVLNWFPPAVIAVMVCGAIMIIAVKISGSGKS